MKISVIVTCCPADRHLLPRCLDSIRWQLHPEDELIVVGDGVQPLPGYHGDGLQQIRIGAAGVSAARNAGLRQAAGDWIKFLDVDDLLCPFALDAIHRLCFVAPVVFGGLIMVHNGRVVGLRPGIKDPQLRASLMKVNVGVVSAAVLWRDSVQDVGGFDERIHFEEDWDLWLRLHRRYGFAGFASVDVPFCFYTRDDLVQADKDKVRNHQVEGVDVREYFRRTYGCTPL